MPQKNAFPVTASPAEYTALLIKVRKTLLEGQKRIEAERVRIYWETGRLIRTHILKYERAARGQETIERLAKDLGVSDTVLHRCVKFVQKYPDQRKVATGPLFSWSHYRKLIAVADDKKRLRLEAAAAQKKWSVDELTARIKEEIPPAEHAPLSPIIKTSVDKLLVPLRGTLFTYRLVERPNLSLDAESGLLVDLGFGVYHAVDHLLSGFSKDEIVESRPKEDDYKFYKTGRTAKDLFTYAAYIEKVIDGDTLKVRLDLGFNVWTRQILRLRDIDCPEVGTPTGDEAKAFVRSHLKEAQQIIVRSSRSDKYDRYLADVFVPALQLNDKNDIKKSVARPASPGGASRGYLINAEPNPQTDVYLNNLLLETGRAGRVG